MLLFKVNISSSVLLLLTASIVSVCASPISNFIQHRISLRKLRSPSNSKELHYQDFPLIFDSSNLEGTKHNRTGSISDYPLGYKYGRDHVSEALEKDFGQRRIDFQQTQPSNHRKYHRRPILRKGSIGLSFRNPSELWSKVDQLEADGKTEFSMNKEATHVNGNPAQSSDEPSRDKGLFQSDQEETEDDLLNMFFSHVKSSSVTKHPPEKIQKLTEKEQKPIKKLGKKAKKSQKDAETNDVIQSYGSDDDDSELAFLTFDSGIQRRQCSSGSRFKDGRCKAQSTIN